MSLPDFGNKPDGSQNEADKKWRGYYFKAIIPLWACLETYYDGCFLF